MRLLIVHDDDGNVFSANVVAREFEGDLVLAAEEGQSVSEIDTSEVKEIDQSAAGRDRDEIENLTSRVIKHFRVDKSGGLVKKRD
jgi:hypothetical protein